ncbi:MAG: hypothetical protein VB064_02990 [Oscillospiraceae bacterium]|nr:hypothetical protein [Oscillospiraceae bacterium]
MALFEGNSLIGWAVEYVNSIDVQKNYTEELLRKPNVSPQEYDRYALLIECQKVMGKTAKACMSTMLKENMFSLGELTEAFVLLEPYFSGAVSGSIKKKT